MGNISFVWLGEVIPPHFIENYKICCKVNPHYTSRIFRDEQIEHLAKVYGVDMVYHNLNLVNRCNLAKYLVLHYYPGVYSDLDIVWKRNVDELISQPVNRFYNQSFWPNYNQVHAEPEFISCVRPYTHIYNGEKVYIFDDHLIYATSIAMAKVIDYSKEKWMSQQYDHSINFEPFGPVSITELIYDKKMNANMWYDVQCQAIGQFCDHLSTRMWE